MSYVVRKIWRSKWKDCDTTLDQTVTSDAVTNCLRTSQNTLSVWFAEREADIALAKLALLATLERFETVELVILDTDEIGRCDLELVSSEGDTVAKTLVNLHRDINTMSLEELAKVARLVQQKLVAGQTERVMKQQFRAIIKKAVEDELIAPSDLPEKMAEDLN